MAVAASAITLGAPAAASAGDDYAGQFILTLPVEGAITIGSITTIVGTSLSLSSSPPPRGWRVASYVMGSLSLAMSLYDGIYLAGIAGQAFIGGPLAAHNLALTIANFRLAGTSGDKADDVAWSPLLTPVRLLDIAGRPAPGVGLVGQF
jgi:hypothetical protein